MLRTRKTGITMNTVMTLSGVRAFVQEHRQVSLDEAARYFGTEHAAVEPLFEYWVSKGKLSKEEEVFSSACCGKCGGKGHTRYHWIG